jgi:hypothetical protein
MARPLDTTTDAHRAQIEAYRRMGGPGRAAVVFRLNDLARQTAMAGIEARHPHYDDERRHLAYARLVLGDELTRKGVASTRSRRTVTVEQEVLARVVRVSGTEE